MTKKIAVISGATGGIGAAVAKRLGQEGYTLVLNGRDREKGLALVSQLQSDKITAEFAAFDITNESEVNQSLQEIGEKYGHIDCVINNAGGLGGRSPIESMSSEFYRSVMALNMDSAFYLSRAAIPYLKKSDYGAIINNTSNAAWNGAGRSGCL